MFKYIVAIIKWLKAILSLLILHIICVYNRSLMNSIFLFLNLESKNEVMDYEIVPKLPLGTFQFQISCFHFLGSRIAMNQNLRNSEFSSCLQDRNELQFLNLEIEFQKSGWCRSSNSSHQAIKDLKISCKINSS